MSIPKPTAHPCTTHFSKVGKTFINLMKTKISKIDLAREAVAAAKIGDIDTLSKCFKAGLPPTVLSYKGEPLASIAAWANQREAVLLLVTLSPAIANQAKDGGYTTLHAMTYTMRGVFKKVLQIMIEAGCAPDFEATTKTGKQVLQSYIWTKPERQAGIEKFITAAKSLPKALFKDVSEHWETIGVVEHPKFGLVVEERTILTAGMYERYRDKMGVLEELNLGDITYPSDYDTAPTLLRHRILSPEEHQQREVTHAASISIASMESYPIPDPYKWRPYQKAGIDFLIKTHQALLADEMGLGKTAEVVGAINADAEIGRVIIVCPALARGVWRQEWALFSTRSDLRLNLMERDEEEPAEIGVIVCSYEYLVRTKWVSKIKWDLAVLDECHFAKNPDAKRTAAATRLRSTRRIAVSGTPMLSKGDDLLPVLGWLRPDLYGQNGKFTESFHQAIQSGDNQLLQRRLRETVMIRRLKNQVLGELPEKSRQIVGLMPEAGSNLAEAIYAETKHIDESSGLLADLERGHALAKLDDEESCDRIARLIKGHLSEARKRLFELRHLIGRSKISDVLEHVGDLTEAGCKTIVFVHHQDVGAALLSRLQSAGIKSALINGSLSAKVRTAIVNDFQTDESLRVLVAGIHSAGQAITLTAATNVVFGEVDWTPAIHLQCEDRAHRMGQKSHVTCQYLVAGELELRICRTLEDKAKTFGETLGAVQNGDSSWFFKTSEHWHHALRGVSFSKLVKRSEKVSSVEVDFARKHLTKRQDEFRNPIDRELVGKLISIPKWSSNQIGAAMMLVNRSRKKI
jgi:SWI/SNF-related matrix-associated actin-dependent regulator 1 of chromatin subfamily A